ncbi:gcn5-related n-acetyltransferase; gcn5-related n-acetyltransferase [Clostridioides difficile]|nr:gcn5-related n-acetyltransferase; gcn5-related n-acetyltransferase [Clostridioides difficile]
MVFYEFRYFRPELWGTSVAKKGLQFCIDGLRNLGYSYITIWVLKDNIRVIKFYKKMVLLVMILRKIYVLEKIIRNMLPKKDTVIIYFFVCDL